MMSLQIDWQTVLLPFLAGVLVLSTHIPLGKRVIARNVVFIDLAIAQFAAFGVVLAGVLGMESHLSGQVFAFTFALMGAIFCFVLEKLFKEKQEALMGCSFVVVACAGLLLASQGSHGAEHVENMLAGQLLWVSRVDVVILAAIALVVGFVHWMRRHLLDRSLVFYIVLGACVTSSVQVIGVYLVFASLMMPALVGAKHKSMAFTKSLLAGSLGYALGIVLSVWFDLPTGAVVVCSLALCCALIGLLLPRR